MLWTEQQDAELPAFAVLTTAANHAMEPVHDRMPAIIPPEHLREWLVDGDTGLLVPAPDDYLLATPASKRVNSAANEGASLWKAEDDAEAEEQLQLALALFPRPRA